MATPGQPARSVELTPAPPSRLRIVLGTLLSYEMLFVLFLYSNELKVGLQFLPGDETLVLGALSVICGLPIVLRRGIHVPALDITGAFLLFLFWVVLSVGWSESRIMAFRTLETIFTIHLGAFAIAAFVVAPDRDRVARFFVAVLLVAFALLLVGTYIQLVHGSFRFWKGWDALEVRRIYLAWGYTLANGICPVLVLAFRSRSASVTQLVCLAFLAWAGAFLLVAGGRGPLLAVLTAVLTLLLLATPPAHRGRLPVAVPQLVFAMFLLFGAAALAMVVSTYGMPLALTRLLKAFSQWEDPSAITEVNRAKLWPQAIAFWWQAPLFGHGISSFSVLDLGSERAGRHPHNVILQVLAELGLVGLGLLLLLVWVAARKLTTERLRSDPLALTAALYALTIFVQSLFNRSLEGHHRMFVALALLAVALPPIRRQAVLGTPGRFARTLVAAERHNDWLVRPSS